MTMRIDRLPGQEVAISDLMQLLSQAWALEDTQQQSEAPHASQMTLVVFSGPDLKDEEAFDVLDQLAVFSKNYPCRILWVLLETQIQDTWTVKAKLQTYSHLCSDTGKSCCEIIMLGCCAQLDRQFLTGLLGTYIHTDLPVYFWMQRLREEHMHCLPHDIHPRCVVFDSSAEPDFKALLKKELAHVEVNKDLAYARSLPTRQAIGQFLSAYDPSLIIKDLQSVTVEHSAHKKGEAHHVLEWVRHCILACQEQCDLATEVLSFSTVLASPEAPSGLKLLFTYKGDKCFQWSCNDAEALAVLEAKLDGTTRGYPLPLRPVPPAWALADALFF